MLHCHAFIHRRRSNAHAGWHAVLWCAMLLLSPAVQAESQAVLAAAEQKLLRSFLERSSRPQPGSTEVIELQRADLDADGREELVMLWGLFGTSSAWPSLTVFRRGPQGWQEAGTQDLAGQVGELKVQGRDILLELRLPARDEPRCCPSRSITSRYRWNGARLVGSPVGGPTLR